MKEDATGVATPTNGNKIRPANAVKNLKLENYITGKKVQTGRYITVFGANGEVKLLNTVQLLPKGIAAALPFPGFGRTLVESFDPQYGYGASPIAGRFSFQRSLSGEVDPFGWYFDNTATPIQELEFFVFMGAWTGMEPSPVQNFIVLELHVYSPYDIDLAVTVNGAEVNYHFDPVGDARILLYLRKPANSNHAVVNLRLDADGTGTGIWIRRVDRYNSIYIPGDVLDTLELG